MKRLKTLIALAFFSALPLVLLSQQQVNFKFSFNPSAEIQDFIRVTPDMKYSPEAGYGFDFGTIPFAVDRHGKKPLNSGFITSDKPFFFSVDLPEGNYRVKIITGDLLEPSMTTVRAESRRLIFEKIKTEKGKFTTLTAVINVRNPAIAGTKDEVKRKPRELNKLDWDHKLTFEFTDKRPCICALEIERISNAVTIFLAGNSTVVDQDDDPWASWGQMFPRFLNQEVAVSNQAESGLSLGSFLSSNRLEKVLSMMKSGDYLFIEFGHNDQKEKGPDDGAYKSYTDRMKRFVNEFRAKGGNPVIVTPANRRSFGDDGKISNSLGEYPDAARKVAKELNVPLIDLNSMTKTLYESLGPEESKDLFVIYPANTFPDQKEALNDNTHFNSYGAFELAKCITKGIRENVPGLRKYLVAMPSFDPSKPDRFEDFAIPLSPHSPVREN
jgi:lysophospholipase L1-like esterase